MAILQYRPFILAVYLTLILGCFGLAQPALHQIPPNMTPYSIETVPIDGVDLFYRYSAPPNNPSAPAILLLHGFPSSSHQYRNLIPLLAKKYRVYAPDFPGFGFTNVPTERSYNYTFDSLTATTEKFVEHLGLKKYAIYIFDYGAPVGERLALRHPEAITAIITQNGNAYMEGFGQEFWTPIFELWKTNDTSIRDAIKGAALTLDGIKGQYVNGSQHPGRIQPESYWLDYALIADRKGNAQIQLDLLYDYRNNVGLYPDFHKYLRESGVPVLAMWGKNDIIFVPPGAEAFKKDVKEANLEINFVDAGHFAIEGNEELFDKSISRFLGKHGIA